MTESVESWSGKGRGDENFPVGVLIRPSLRGHVHAFYSFARNADDIADAGELEAADKLRRLEVMRAVLVGEADGGAPSAMGLRASLAETGVSAGHALDLLRAFRQDAVKRRYASWEELLEYCRYSAMPVGRHVLDLHGEDVATYGPSDPLCAVLQVLNHLQDGKKDLAALDRCYLPEDRLVAAGASVGELAGGMETKGLRVVFDGLLDECDRLMAVGAGLPGVVRDRRLRVECGVIVGLARRLSRRLRGGDPVAGRVKLVKVDVVGSVVGALRWAA